MSTLTADSKAQIVLAAINAVGPDQGDPENPWGAQVAQKAAEIAVMAYGNRSSAVKAIDGVTGPNTKVFTATIVDVVKEASSTRGLVTLKTKPSKFHEDGIEQARTERTDDPAGRAMARALRAVKGHRVAIWIEVEEINGGTGKVRVIRHFEDLGPDNRPES